MYILTCQICLNAPLSRSNGQWLYTICHPCFQKSWGTTITVSPVRMYMNAPTSSLPSIQHGWSCTLNLLGPTWRHLEIKAKYCLSHSAFNHSSATTPERVSTTSPFDTCRPLPKVATSLINTSSPQFSSSRISLGAGIGFFKVDSMHGDSSWSHVWNCVAMHSFISVTSKVSETCASCVA